MNELPNPPPVESVYIVEPENQGWIIERLMRDLATQLEAREITTRIGPPSAYAGENVIFNSRYLTPLHDRRARVNSLFITHIDDRIREVELRRSFANFNSFVCLSPHDAEFVAGLKGNGEGVVGIVLPPRDLNVRPLRAAIFSACYEDKRKNEDWITDYFRSRPRDFRETFIFCFLGHGWENFGQKLADLKINFEIHSYSRELPNEYDLYKLALAHCDILLYPGFDGGAMSVYDAISSGIDVIATNISYHRGLGETVRLFDNQAGFFAELDRLQSNRAERIAMLGARSVVSYTDALLAHWNRCVGNVPAQISVFPNDRTVAEFRQRYAAIGFSRLRSAAIRFLQYAWPK